MRTLQKEKNYSVSVAFEPFQLLLCNTFVNVCAKNQYDFECCMRPFKNEFSIELFFSMNI